MILFFLSWSPFYFTQIVRYNGRNVARLKYRIFVYRGGRENCTRARDTKLRSRRPAKPLLSFRQVRDATWISAEILSTLGFALPRELRVPRFQLTKETLLNHPFFRKFARPISKRPLLIIYFPCKFVVWILSRPIIIILILRNIFRNI